MSRTPAESLSDLDWIFRISGRLTADFGFRRNPTWPHGELHHKTAESVVRIHRAWFSRIPPYPGRKARLTPANQ
jgi:hypothetical protein